jgi:beta-lactamase regulating signal transducer with metallopeptidase domain
MNIITHLSTMGVTLWIMLLEISVLLLAATLSQRALIHSPAARHAVLFWAILTLGVCPLFVFASRHEGLGTRITLPSPLVPSALLAAPPPLVPSDMVVRSAGPEVAASTVFAFVPWLLGVWVAGALVMLLRLARGLQIIARIRRGAMLVSGDTLGPVEIRLRSIFGDRLPKILTSHQLSTPVAVGFFRPVIILPSTMAAQLQQHQLLQVLVHEIAHALRRDPLMGLYQRVVAAVFWFHPLVHLVNHQLNLAREELCDNHVLHAAAPTDYARTLLQVAESLPTSPDGFLAPTLSQSKSQLELRVVRLLNERRNVMTQLNSWKLAAIAAAFITTGFLLGSVGVQSTAAQSATAPGVGDTVRTAPGVIPTTTPDSLFFPDIVPFEQGATQFLDGDRIIITEVRGTASAITPGNIYCIKGTYTLASHPQAMLAAFITAMNSAEGKSVYLKVQKIMVDKGEGTFVLFLPVTINGSPHVSFYPADGGESFGGSYFGTGKTVLKQWWGSAPTVSAGTQLPGSTQTNKSDNPGIGPLPWGVR